MGRIRAIKPEFFKHEELQDLEINNPGQHIMLTYAGLWTLCDKNGVFLCKARIVKNEVLPFLDFDMQKTLNILEAGKFFTKFKHEGKEYGYIKTFSKYQFPTKQERESKAKYPMPPLDNVTDNVTTDDIDNGTDDYIDPEGIRNKEKGIKEEGSCAKAPADGSDEPPQSLKDANELSELLLTTHRKEIPDYLSGKDKTTIPTWAGDIEKLIRIDKKPPETIREVILWAKRPGNFWFPNIMSGKKLRDKFEMLYGQMITGGKRHGTGPPQFKIKSDNIPDDELSQYFTEA
jgi:hypothetical protein